MTPRDVPSQSETRHCVVKAKGGMGNRMLCAASGLIWARAVGRACFVDWRDDAYSREGENSLFQFFDPPHAIRDPEGIDDQSVEPAVWQGRLDMSPSKLFHEIDPAAHRSISAHKRYSIDPRRSDHAARTVVFWHYMDQIHASARVVGGVLPGYRGLGYTAMLSKALREELPLRADLAEWVDRFAAEHFDRPTIGVHIRYSDRKAPVARCTEALRRLRQKLPDARVFLATDSRAVENDFKREFGEVVVTEKWLPEPGEAAHQNPNCDDPVANGVEALRDMMLLARCTGLVYARRSTFSFVSHCVGSFERGMVIDVDRADPKIIARRLIRRLVA